MDSKCFDTLARTTARATSRRVALRTLLGAAGIAAVPSALAGSAVAGTKCRKNGASCKGKGTGTTCCSKRCQQGVCVCRGKGGRCAFDGGCCSGRCGKGRCK